MHKQVNALVSAGGSPGKLATFALALAGAELDIEVIGGAEWKHDGPLCLVLREDNQENRDKFAEVCHQLQVPWLSFSVVTVEMADEIGSLGQAALAIGDINIYGVLVRKPQGNRAVVDMGFAPDQVETALELLRAAKFTANRKHHPNEPDGPDAWDDRTTELLPLWDDAGVAKDDERFWQMADSS